MSNLLAGITLVNKVFQKIYWPICRLYAKWLGDRPADDIYKFLCSVTFFQIHHYWPRLNNPITFSEKVLALMLFDRNKFLSQISDKLAVRSYIQKTIGENYLIPLLWASNNPSNIPWDILPEKFVIKANHGCGYTLFVKNKASLNFDEVMPKLTKWLNTNFALSNYMGHAWAYKNIKPKIMIEEYIEEDGIPPKDYKFFCFMGRVEYILITYDRFSYHREKHFTRDFEPLDLWNGADQYPGPFIKPKNFDEMIRIAEILSSDFDFIRVDLYNVNGKIYFGELTCYPAGGLAPFVPRKWDFIFGEKWNFHKRKKEDKN